MRLSQICIAIAQLGRGGAWSPLALWPDGIATPGMWISPRDLTSQWQDSAGTTPVSVPGTVADASNPVGLALDIRAGATVLTDPGNHMLQSTSAARPLMSARVNLLTYTEDFSSGWTKSGCTTPASALTPPAGYSGAVKYIKNTGGGLSEVYRMRPCSTDSNWSITAKREEWRYLCMYASEPFGIGYFDLEDGVIASETSGLNASIVPEGDGWYRCSILHEYTGASIVSFFGTTADGQLYPTGDGTSGISVTGAQVSLGLDIAPYQSVPGDGSTYATDFPIAQLYDGVDDGMATAAFSAGTLIDGMDLQIAVRRDSASSVASLGIYGNTGGGKFAGFINSGPYQANYECGTPTTWVNGVQVAGGTSVTQDVLGAAVPVGEWCILEFKNLDLSGWTFVGFGAGYPGFGYLFNGARGDIFLFPSTASTEDKDAARQWLADYYGVTLP